MNAPLKSSMRVGIRAERRIWRDDPSRENPANTQPLMGDLLVKKGLISSSQLLTALALQARQNVPLGEILVAQGFVVEEEILRLLAKQHDTYLVKFAAAPPDPRLSTLLAPEDCLRLGFVPWRMQGNHIVLATAHPERINSIRVKLPPNLANAKFVLAAHGDVQDAIHLHYGEVLAAKAEERTAPQDSCRNWSTAAMRLVLLAFAVISIAGILYAPVWLI